MILSRRVALDNVQLDSLDSSIVIRSFDPGTTRENIQITDRMGGAGSRVTTQHWQMLEAKLVFAIDVPKTNVAKRVQVFDLVKAWALKKGWLTFNGLSTLQMWVEQVVVPSRGDLRVFDEEYTILFRNYNVPFWLSKTHASASAQLSTGVFDITIPGDVETVLNARITNSSGGVLDAITIGIDGHQLVFTAMTLANGDTLVINHGTDGLLRATVDGETVYGKLTGSDDLITRPGTRTVSVECEGTLDVVVSCQGRFL